MADPVRVVLCDDHGVVRSGFRLILEAAEDIAVVGQAATGEEAITIAAEVRPDVLVMDVGLPDMSGIDATAQVLTASPGTRVLMLTVHDDVAYLRGSFDAGAAGYLLKEAADVELVEAVRQVASGRQYVHPTMGAALLAPEAGPRRLGGPGGAAVRPGDRGAAAGRARPDESADRRGSDRVGPDRRDAPFTHLPEARRE